MICKRFIISGRVQGVGFRWSTKSKAEELDLSGYVKNKGDGTVEVVVYGENSKLEEIEKWLESGGPRFSEILKIDKQEIAEKFPKNQFSIISGVVLLKKVRKFNSYQDRKSRS